MGGEAASNHDGRGRQAQDRMTAHSGLGSVSGGVSVHGVWTLVRRPTRPSTAYGPGGEPTAPEPQTPFRSMCPLLC